MVFQSMKFFETAKILLDAPIMDGGIVTEEINVVFDKYTKKDKK